MKLTVGMILNPIDVDWAILSLKSAMPIADEFVIIEDGKYPSELKKLEGFIKGDDRFKLFHVPYKGSNGLQYAEVLKHATSDWILILDADEVLGDNTKNILNYLDKEKSCYDMRMEHVVYNFSWMDSTMLGNPYTLSAHSPHYVIKRLFRNREGIYWDAKEHGSVQGFGLEERGTIKDVTIWHYGNTKSMMQLKNKYEMNLERSTDHPKEYLDVWYGKLLSGKYPIKECDLSSHPSIIKEAFHFKEIGL